MPLTPPVAGVTVMMEVMGAVVVLVAGNDAILPLPLAASPVAVLLLVQLKLVPVPVKLIAAVDPVLHTVWLVTDEITVGKVAEMVVLPFSIKFLMYTFLLFEFPPVPA